VLVPISSTKISRLALIPASPATTTRQASLSHSSHSVAPTEFFSAPSETLEVPGNCGVANLHSAYPPQELAPPCANVAAARSRSSASSSFLTFPPPAWAWSRRASSGPETFPRSTSPPNAWPRRYPHTRCKRPRSWACLLSKVFNVEI
jgi:hypothetical protein